MDVFEIKGRQCIKARENISQALLNIRVTPVDNKLPSPAEMLFGRTITHERFTSTTVPRPRSEGPGQFYKNPDFWKSHNSIPRTKLICC
uniref:Uncharacterized protein n=1 Tax=Scleropages formosus TaxID=113540 RepID=A0A8C9WJF0_SCLFO